MHIFDTFLQTLADAMEMKKLTPDKHGTCLLIMKEQQIPLLFELDEQLVPNTILVSVPISPIPIEYRSAVYEAILIANQQIEETLSLKSDEEMIYIHRRFHPFIQYKELSSLLQNFLESVKRAKMTIKRIVSKPPRKDRIPALPPFLQTFLYHNE